jgi:CheY-like chemotaxis protein
VLLVDDNRDAREMYTLLLQADGHEVYQAADGAEALTVFRRERPHIAFVDIGLPGLDGHEVAREIRREPLGHQVTLVALTGYGFPEDRERTYAAGFDRHLVKPAGASELRRELARTVPPDAESS